MAEATEQEQKIQQAFAAGQLDDAASVTLEAYGDEILSFLVSRLRTVSARAQAFSSF